MQIVPSILVPTFAEFSEQAKRLSPVFPLLQIDVMDGEFVDNKSFDEVGDVKNIENLPDLELHLMVRHPLEEMEKWSNVKNIKKIIFHIESSDDPLAVINAIHGRCAQTGIALNPETPLGNVLPYADRVNEILFMTVHPGHQGAAFVPEVKNKILEFAKLENRPLCAVDGGINENNIAEVKSWGVDVFCVGSALTKTDNPQKTLDNLLNKIK
jgi:ribulose-phosphate 3-epimerase